MGIVLTDIDLVNMNTAISTNFLLWALLMFSCPDSGWTTQAEEMASLEVKMTNIMDRITKMEAEMVAKDEMVEVRDKRIAVLEAAMETKDNPPIAYQCAWKDAWTADYSVITYDRLTFDEISGGDGGLDINTGVFTVGQGYSGIWEVTYSVRSFQYSGEANQAWLTINGATTGQEIWESVHETSYGGADGWVASLGSRSLYMRLESGDTISIKTGNVGHGLEHITLCFQLAQSDSLPSM